MKYAAYGKVVGSKFLGVFEADSEEEAIEKVLESEQINIALCHHCSDQCEDAEVVEVTVERQG